MEKKDRYLLLEVCLTFLLLFLVISLFGEILSAYRLYLILGLAFGFCFSWFIRDKYNRQIRLFVTVATFAVLAWMIYSTLNSSLLYKDVILICIKGALVLEIIISLSACLPPFLTYIQALSIPLFMSYPVFIKDNYNDSSVILTIAYIISWLAIFKVKFYEWFSLLSEKNIKHYISISISGIFFLIILIASWAAFSKFPLGEFRKGGVLPEEGPGEERGLEDEYYGWQDRLQGKITRLVPKLNSTEDKHEVLYLLSSLIKESPYVTEVDKAELGLISHIKQPGPGIEDKDTSSSLKSYVEKKILLNLKKDKDKIIDTLKNNPLDIKNRISILSRVNKMQYGNSYDKVSQNENELRKNINATSLSANAKRDAKEAARRLKVWKAFEIYRKKLDSLDKGIDSLEGDLKKEFTDYTSKAKELEKPSDYKEMGRKLKNLKEGAPGRLKELIKELEKVSDLKFEMSLAAKNMGLKEKLESSNLSKNKIMELKENADNITEARDYQTLAKNANALKEGSEESHLDISGELQELLETKTYSLIKETKNKIEDILKESALPDAQRKEFLKEIEKLESVKNLARLTSEIKKLEAAIDKFLNQSFISKEARDSLIKEMGQLKGLLLSQLEAQDKELAKQREQADSQKKWEELIEELPLKEETKETLRKLTEELSRTDTISRLENIKQAVEKELAVLSKEGMKEEVERAKETFKQLFELKRMRTIDKSLSNLNKNIEKLKEMDPQVNRIVEEHLRKLRESSTAQEFQKRLDILKEYIDSQVSKTQEAPEEHRELNPWQIYIMPGRLVVPFDSFVSLKAVAIYNKIFIKELGSELEWFSSEPDVAGVDERGVVHSLSKGTTKISARYRGKTIEGAEVIVVDKVAEGVDSEIKDYLLR